MAITERGSTWKKWDLHVHTPESLIHNYPGEKEAAWEAFLTDLADLPAEFKVLGINDYLFVDGYERVMNERKKGRLPNIDLVLPVVELRMDKFGGILEKGTDGQYSSSPWSRINLHVIFDELDPAFIREQFLYAISRTYKLVSGANEKWGGVVTRENLIALGNTVIASMPEAAQVQAPSPLKAGFNNLNVSYDGLKEALQNPQLSGKYLIAVGKSEWDDLKWNDHTIADKKTVINEADLVFTASANPQAYTKARNALKNANVNARLLDCSDAHSLSTSNDKDRVGNCFTWIKADSTFQGLLQAIQEFEDRVFVGDNPPKRAIVEQNKTKFIDSVKIQKKPDSPSTASWFDVEIPLNSDLVAIIGNKGSGKSALSDIVALLGNTRNHANFSFLKENRFRNSKTKFAQQFAGILRWRDGTSSTAFLDKNPDPISVERVKYLPQLYLEVLCTELGEQGSKTFDAELRKIIYSHVPMEDRLGKSSMNELLDFKVTELERARKTLRESVAQLNRRIVEADYRSTSEFKNGLEEQLAVKEAELKSVEDSKPQPINDPNASTEAQEEAKAATANIDALEKQLLMIEQEESDLREGKLAVIKRQAIAKRISQALVNYKNQHEIFLGELQPLLKELGGDISIDKLIKLMVDSVPLDIVDKEMVVASHNIDAMLRSNEPDSIAKRREAITRSIFEEKSKLGERQRQYVRYKEELASWEKAKLEIFGAVDKSGTIAWLKAEIASLTELPSQLKDLKAKRNQLTKEIHKQIQAMVNEYQHLYEPVQKFVQSAQEMDMPLPLQFHVRIEESGFEDQFFKLINRNARGTFAGVDESSQRLRGILQESNFATADGIVAFTECIDHMLQVDKRDGQQEKPTRLMDQIRKEVDTVSVLDCIFGLDYLSPRYSLTYEGQEIGQLSPGERGLLLLVFYLLVDKEDIPLIIDQPEENLDNQTIFKILVKCIKKAKERRQIIMVTHNPNLAVVCDAEQIIYASCNKQSNRFQYESGAIEHPDLKARVVQILEGTEPAFKNRQSKYRLP